MIGFFDSGIGGQNYMKEFNAISDIPTLYFCDPENVPFGSKTPEQITSLTIDGVKYLFENGCKLVILACNTASVRSIRYIQQQWLPQSAFASTHQVLGISTPFLEYIQENISPDSKSIVFGTPSTIRSQFYQEFLWEKGYSNIEFYPLAQLASIVETNPSEAKPYIESEIAKLEIRPETADNVLLACTHYHNVEKEFQSIFSRAVVHNHMRFCAEKLLDYVHKHPEYMELQKNRL